MKLIWYRNEIHDRWYVDERHLTYEGNKWPDWLIILWYWINQQRDEPPELP